MDVFAEWPEAQLVIRIHPAEAWLPLQITRGPLLSYLQEQRPNLPPNVRIIPPNSSVSSYDLAAVTSVGLVYASTIGLELAAMGKPVVVAGQVHYAGKGFTFDVPTREAYSGLLHTALNEVAVDRSRAERALQYAHFFFFSVMLPFH